MTPDRPRSGSDEAATDGGASGSGADATGSGSADSPGRAEPERIGERDRQTGRPEGVTAAEEIDWRGWLLVGLVLVCFLVIPATVLYLPQAQGVLGSLGLSLRQAYLALPMIPAIVLGVVAVWAAVRTQARE